MAMTVPAARRSGRPLHCRERRSADLLCYQQRRVVNIGPSAADLRLLEFAGMAFASGSVAETVLTSL